jgi:hypothetical protein
MRPGRSGEGMCPCTLVLRSPRSGRLEGRSQRDSMRFSPFAVLRDLRRLLRTRVVEFYPSSDRSKACAGAPARRNAGVRRGVRDASAAVSAGALRKSVSGPKRPERGCRLVVVLKAIRAASLGFLVQARSTTASWAHERSLGLPLDGRGAVRRRATLSEDGGRHPGGAASHPRPQTHGDAPLVGGSGWRIGIFSGDVKGREEGGPRLAKPAIARTGRHETSARIFARPNLLKNERSPERAKVLILPLK